MKYYLSTNNGIDFLINADQKEKLEEFVKNETKDTFRLENCTIKSQYVIGIFTEKKIKEKDIAKNINRCYECGQVMLRNEICDCILTVYKDAEQINKNQVDTWNKYVDVRKGFGKAYHEVRNTNVKEGLLPPAEVNEYTNKLTAKIGSNTDMRKIPKTIRLYAEDVIHRFPTDPYSTHRYSYIQFFEKGIYLTYMI